MARCPDAAIASLPIILDPYFDMRCSITGSASTGSPDPGALFSYTFQVKNSGPDTASAVSFRDPLPLGTGYVSATANGAAAGNFETSGAAWLVLRMPRTTPGGLGATAIWELHTSGLTGPSLSGTVVLQNYNRIAVSYDPDAVVVVGSVNGVPTAALPCTVSGVRYVGFQGNGIVNDFLVSAGAIAPQ